MAGCQVIKFSWPEELSYALRDIFSVMNLVCRAQMLLGERGSASRGLNWHQSTSRSNAMHRSWHLVSAGHSEPSSLEFRSSGAS